MAHRQPTGPRRVSGLDGGTSTLINLQLFTSTMLFSGNFKGHTSLKLTTRCVYSNASFLQVASAPQFPAHLGKPGVSTRFTVFSSFYLNKNITSETRWNNHQFHGGFLPCRFFLLRGYDWPLAQHVSDVKSGDPFNSLTFSLYAAFYRDPASFV